MSKNTKIILHYPKYQNIIEQYLKLDEYSGLREQPVRRLRATFPAAQSQASVAESH